MKNSVTTNMPEAQKQITESIQTAEADVKSSTDNMSKDTNKNMGEVEEKTTDSFKEVRETSESEWEDSYDAVNKALEGMETDTKKSMGNVISTIQFYWSSVVKNTNQIWELMSRKVNTELGNMIESADSAGREISNALARGMSGAEYAIVGVLNNIVSRVNNMINNINNALGGVERAFTFSYDFYNPMTQRRYWGNYWMNLPRVNYVPYLAKGAVIPPQSEFLAVLGDQRHGTNIEAPLSTIEQAVKNVIGSGTGDIHVTAEVGGRTLLDIVIDEAELRRARNGKNPFALGGV